MNYLFSLLLLIILLITSGCISELKSNNPSWIEPNSSSGWSARGSLTGVVAMPDGSIVLMGGMNNDINYRNDTWHFLPVSLSKFPGGL